MAKHTKEEKQKAVDLYIRYCRQATKVIKELGECGRFLGLFFQVASGNNERKEYCC